MEAAPGRGHRAMPHTADLHIEAWAPTREECIAEAVAGTVESFVSVPGDAHTHETSVEVVAETDDDLLVTALDEIIYLIETDEVVPVHTDARQVPAGLYLDLTVAALDQTEFVGAAPKAVTLHGLAFSAGETGWSASVIIDV